MCLWRLCMTWNCNGNGMQTRIQMVFNLSPTPLSTLLSSRLFEILLNYKPPLLSLTFACSCLLPKPKSTNRSTLSCWLSFMYCCFRLVNAVNGYLSFSHIIDILLGCFNENAKVDEGRGNRIRISRIDCLYSALYSMVLPAYRIPGAYPGTYVLRVCLSHAFPLFFNWIG